MAWLLKLSILILAQVLKCQCNPDKVTVKFQLHNYRYTGDEYTLESPVFLINVTECGRTCGEVSHYMDNADFKEYKGHLSKSTAHRHNLNLQYEGGEIKFFLERQNYNETLYLTIRQQYNNSRVETGEDYLVQYCSNISTDDLVRPFNISPNSTVHSCRIGVTLVAECPDNYFGAQCDTYCIPTDDPTAGHYNCSSNGEKLCVQGYDGINCSHNIDDCYNISCSDDGTCQDGLNTYTCLCKDGFNGTHCENDIDDCVNNDCQNGGTCHDGIMNYTCSCSGGFTGNHCESNIDDCVNNDCQNGGTCHDGLGTYSCSCKEGFNGTHCENNIDDCVSNVCQNGGTCHDRVMDYTCLCKQGFSGVHCERPSSTSKAPLTPKIENASSPQKSTNIASIAGGAGGAVFVLVVVVGFVIYLRRRRRRPENQDQLNQNGGQVTYNSTNGVNIHTNGVNTKTNLQDVGLENGYNNEIYEDNEGTQL